MGSVVSGIGSVLGGVTGGLTSALGGLGPKYTDTDSLQGISNQQQAGAQDAQAQLTGLKDQRSQFGQALANQALGQAPSIAEAQLKMAMDRNLSQQIAASKANRAVNPALAARAVNIAAGQQAQAVAQQSAVNKLAEQQQAQQMFGNYLGQQQQAGAQFLGGAGQTQSGVMNTQFANQQRGINTFSGLAQAGAQAFAMSDANLKTLIKKYNKGGVVKSYADVAKTKPKKMADGGLIKDITGGSAISEMQDSTAKSQQDAGSGFGAMLSKLGSGQSAGLMAGGPMDSMGGAMSAAPLMVAAHGALVPGQAKVEGDSEANDMVHAMLSPGEVVVPRTIVKKGSKAVAKFVAETIKKEGQQDKPVKMSNGGKVAEKPAADEFNPKSFLDALQATSFEYKKNAKGIPTAGEGRYMGVMAQDLEKAGPVGKSLVNNTAQGKQIDMGKGFNAILAAQASLNQRLNEIEKKWKKD